LERGLVGVISCWKRFNNILLTVANCLHRSYQTKAEIGDNQFSSYLLHNQRIFVILVKLPNFNEATRRDSSVGRAED
jgi:hypothetical protein